MRRLASNNAQVLSKIPNEVCRSVNSACEGVLWIVGYTWSSKTAGQIPCPCHGGEQAMCNRLFTSVPAILWICYSKVAMYNYELAVISEGAERC